MLRHFFLAASGEWLAPSWDPWVKTAAPHFALTHPVRAAIVLGAPNKVQAMQSRRYKV